MRRLERVFCLLVIATLLFVVGSWLGVRLERRSEHFRPHEEDTATVIQQVQTLADLVTVKYVIEKVEIVDAPPETTWGQFVQGDNRILLLAHGVVKAGFDLKQLAPEDIRIAGNTIRLRLPPPQITDAYLDEDQTKVIDWKQGFLRSFDKNLEQTARQMAIDDIQRAARRDGILKEASDRGEWQLAQFFQKAGFEHVEFTTASPANPAILAVPKN